MTDSQFSCYLIGSDTLLMECGDHLLAEGHDVRGVITSEPRVARWASDSSLAVLDAGGDYASEMAKEPFDYLFAITHLSIIPDEILDLPGRRAINFHDGPLPRYAGLNTPVWALVNGEPSHGVTWHVMTTGVDAGDILAQELVEISPTETALSLNTKCLAAASEVFPLLVSQLSRGEESLTPQDLSARTYFGKFKRLPAACALDWTGSADDIEAFVRALTFGPYPNPVGVPKVCRAERPAEPILVTDLEVVDTGDGASGRPGAMVEVSDAGLVVATGDGHVTITGGQTLAGADLTPTEIAERLQVEPGDVLATTGSELTDALTAADEELCRHEDFWSRRLAAAEPPELPLAGPAGVEAPSWRRSVLHVPDAVGERFGELAALAILAAFVTYLARTGRKEQFAIAHPAVDLDHLEGWYGRTVPISVDLEDGASVVDVVGALAAERDTVLRRRGFLRDLVRRQPQLADRPELAADAILPVGVAIGANEADGPPPGGLLSLEISGDGRSAELVYDANCLPAEAADAIRAAVDAGLEAIASDPDRGWHEIALVPTEERDRQLVEWNRTDADYEADRCVHELFEAQVDRTPDAEAVAFRDECLTYRELDERANALANFLRGRGVGPDTLVGVNVDRSVELLVATLGVMKAGGAYVPLDPEFPADRIALMVEDSGTRIVVTQGSLAGDLPETDAEVVRIDTDWAEIEAGGTGRPGRAADPSNLAYAIYTSGSTGRPKGVLVEHRNVSNFFTGMDAVIEHDPPGVWLAVTSLSFDISVLELFWTLARGFKVVVYKDPDRSASVGDGPTPDPALASQPMEFGLFMWGNDDGPTASKYELMLEAAKFFDANGFDSAWTPERHFHAFGGPFPNPSVTGAAIAAVTENIGIRSGSCVSPLHHPIRIAEEWAVVDNLSNGRVGLSFASGWQPNDFVIRPQNFPGNKQIMLEQIDIVRRLWRGEEVEFENPNGDMVGVATLPRPVQAELPFWVTTAGNPDSYRNAGAMGANVLTHLLGQSVDDVAEKIAIYRAAREEAGLDPAAGTVTLMLHTFVGDRDDEVRELVRQPMKDYLGASMKLVLGFAWAFPAFKRPGGSAAKVEDVDLSTLSPEEEDAILDFAFDRYFETSGLFGTPETCLRMVERCKAIGVDEIACLLDFGVDTAHVLGSLPALKQVRDAANPARAVAPVDAGVDDDSFAAQVRRHRVTHLQCTPSMARMLVEDQGARAALGEIGHVMIGGEAFPPALASELLDMAPASLTNMYGPTETTIWSSTHRLSKGDSAIPIGRPIANTSMYVLDRHRQPLPVGVPGDLYIGGDGVTRGYHNRAELTDERFVADPFRGNGARMYATGDLARFEPDGTLGFLGRIDNQVKIRGYRIELGEIEAQLNRHDTVGVAAVVVREAKAGDQRLVAFLVPSGSAVDDGELRSFLRGSLPEYMIPSHLVAVADMPLTPNGKIDRAALPGLDDVMSAAPTEYVAPTSDLEKTIAEAWCVTLGLERVGVEDNFFDVGGHSLLVVQLHRTLSAAVEHQLSLVDLYRFPTIRSLTDHLTADGSGEELQRTADRAEKRKAVMAGRRRRRG